MDKYVIAPPEGSTNNSVGASDRPWKEGHFDSVKLNGGDLGEYLAESTGYGIVSGCEPSISGLTVTVGAGVVHLADGTRKELSATNITLDAADASNPRIDLVYINADGVVAKVTGTASASPSAPDVPSGGISVCNVSVAAGATTGTITDKRNMLPRYYNTGIVNVKDFGAVGDGVTDDTLAVKKALATGNKVYFPRGRYRITETLALYAGAVICGDSRRKTFLIADGCDFASGGGSDISHIEISNLTIQGDSTHVGLNVSGGNSNNGGRYSVFYKVDFSGFDTDVILGKCWCVTFYSCRFGAENTCVQQNNECLNITYIGCQFLGNTEDTTNIGCRIHETCKTTVFDKCDFERLNFAVYTAGGNNVSVINFHSESIRSYLLYANATSNTKIANGYCYNVKRIALVENTQEYTGKYVVDVEDINMVGTWDSETNMVNISNSNTNANIKNINIANSGSGDVWLCSIDSSRNDARKDNVMELIDTESFSTTVWGTKNYVNTIYKNSYESIKAISAYLTVLEDFTTSTSTQASVVVLNNNVEIFRMNIPSGTYTKGSKINANRSSSTITNYITDDLSNVTVKLNSPTSVTTSCKVSILFGVGEMKAIS